MPPQQNRPTVPAEMNPFTSDDFARIQKARPQLANTKLLCEKLIAAGIDVSSQLGVCDTLEALFDGVQGEFGPNVNDVSTMQ